jgi:hypothetical protein
LSLRRVALAAAFVLVAALMFAFAWQDKLASFGDDSVSYLVLANYFAGSSGNAFAAQWAAYHSHFPPLFPALLWLSGGVSDYRIAYALVAAFAVLAVPLIYRYSSMQLGSDRAGFVVVLVFLMMPTAWIALKGIMSESLYLFLAMACLFFFETRITRREAGAGDLFAFGVLLALACLARVLGVALVAAYVMHTLIRIASREEKARARLWLPLVPVVVALAAWYVLRPVAGPDTYGRTLGQVAGWWSREPLQMLVAGTDHLSSAWIATFAAQDDVPRELAAVALGVGLAALAGAGLRLARNRLDAWFVFASLAIVFPWVFSAENTRRLIYPLVPLLILSGADFVRWAMNRARLPIRSHPYVLAVAAAAPVLAILPALVLIAQKSLDREPVLPGSAYTYRDVSEYFTTVNLEAARDRAKLAVVTLEGLRAIDRVTTPSARVMWMRPEYVALLGHRQGVPFLYRWSPLELAREVKGSGTGFIVQGWLAKTDIDVAQGASQLEISAYTRVAFNTGNIFMLMAVDPAALDAYIARGGTPG